MNRSSSKRRSKTDWQRVLRMRDDKIDVSEIPPLDENFIAEAIFVPGKKKKKKKSVTLRLDHDVVAFFRKQGRGYQAAINAVLRGYIQSEKVHARKRRSSHAAD